MIWCSRKVLLALSLSLMPVAAVVAKNNFPDQPIRLLVGYSPGGSVDIVAREYAPRLAALPGLLFLEL